MAHHASVYSHVPRLRATRLAPTFRKAARSNLAVNRVRFLSARKSDTDSQENTLSCDAELFCSELGLPQDSNTNCADRATGSICVTADCVEVDVEPLDPTIVPTCAYAAEEAATLFGE